MANEFARYNRANVLENVEKLIRESEEYKKAHPYYGYKKFFMTDVYERLSIFDWWRDMLSLSNLKEMRAFLIQAGKLGYNGYVCFKVGASGCANGMWANKEESTTGYSPDGEFLYRSFSPDYVTYDARLADGTMAHSKYNDRCDITLNEIKALIGA